MTENKRTDYSKVKRKTEPTTVRFNSEQLIFIQKREPSLKSKQMVLDFLLDAYCRTYKVQPSNPFEQQPNEHINQFMRNFVETKVEPLKLVEPKIKLKRSYANYQQLKIDCSTAEEWQELKEEILTADNLTRQEKISLTI